MADIIIDTLIDTVKIVPFLFIAFLVMEYLEHKVKSKSEILKTKKIGPLVGSFLGIIPQCGFSVVATNLFASRVITIGTLIAVYLSTSDEMLPLLIAGGVKIQTIIIILLIKVTIAIIFGYIIDLLFFKKREIKNLAICHDDNCHCEESIIKSSLIHTIKISFFILITTFILNLIIDYSGGAILTKLLSKGHYFGPLLASLVGLIPNCCASVIITELYIKGMITTGMLIGGLLTGAGVGLLVLFKVNKDKKENILILLSLYIIGSLVGILIDLLKISI